MIWPFVSRALLTIAERRADACERREATLHEHYGQMLLREQERFDALAERYHTLKLLGGAPPNPAPAPAQKPVPDPVTQAIIMKAGTSRQLRLHYAGYVTEQRAAGVSDEDIAQAIIQGVTDDEGVPG